MESFTIGRVLESATQLQYCSDAIEVTLLAHGETTVPQWPAICYSWTMPTRLWSHMLEDSSRLICLSRAIRGPDGQDYTHEVTDTSDPVDPVENIPKETEKQKNSEK